MKNLKKIFTCIMAVTTLRTVSIISINANADAIVVKQLSEETIKYYEKNSGTYYVGALDYIAPSISTDIFTDEEINMLNQAFLVIVDDGTTWYNDRFDITGWFRLADSTVVLKNQ